MIRQVIKLEPTDSQILFALHPILDADSPDRRYTPELNDSDGTLFRGDTRSTSFDYQVTSASKPEIPQPGENYPSGNYLGRLLSMPEDLKARNWRRSPWPTSGTSSDDPGSGSAPRPWSSGSASPASSATRSRWSRATPTSTRSRTSWSESEGRALRVFRQRPGAAPPLDRHPDPDDQRLQGRRLQRHGRRDDGPPEARP